MENGTSLCEGLITLSVLSILAVIATPAASSWLERNRLETATQQIRQDMAFARSQAVILQRAVSIQPVAVNCWGCGWQVQYATDTGQPATPTSAVTQALMKRDALDKRLKITSSQPWRAGATFMPNGAAVQANGAFAAGTFVICTANSNIRYKVIISKSGRARTLREQAGCL